MAEPDLEAQHTSVGTQVPAAEASASCPESAKPTEDPEGPCQPSDVPKMIVAFFGLVVIFSFTAILLAYLVRLVAMVWEWALVGASHA